MQTLQRTFAVLIVAAIGCLGAACQQMTAPTQPPPPAAALSVRGILDDDFPGDDLPDEDECDDDDNDGVTNVVERLLGTLPTVADSDGDGIDDGLDDANGNGRPDGDEHDDDDDECVALPSGPAT